MSGTDTIALHLDRSSALVLFELLARSAQSGRLEIAHEAERTVLAALEAELETILVEPFDPNYRDLVDKAREALVADS